MRVNIERRTIALAEYIIERKCTVRHAAKNFGISKSTVHKDLITRLPGINCDLFEGVRRILDINLSERHLRGGEATKKKYSSAV